MKKFSFSSKFKIIFFLILITHLVLIALTLTGKLNFLFNDASLRKGKAADFFAVYQAGDNFTKSDSIYHDTEGVSTPYSFPYRYLPFMGYTIGVIVNLFKPFTAYYIQVFFYELLLAINIFLTYKISKNAKNFLSACIAWLLFCPYLLEVFMGQWSFLLATLLFWSVLGLAKKSKLIYSFILAPLIKPNGLILAPLLFLKRKWKLLGFALLATALTSGVYFFFFKDDIDVFLKNFVDAWYSSGGNLGFKSLYYLVFIKHLGVPKPRIWFYGFIGVLAFINIYLTIKSKNIVKTYALWICLYFFIYMDVWEHHYVLLMPVYCLLLATTNLKKLFSKSNVLLTSSFLIIALPSIFSLQYLFVSEAPVDPDSLNTVYVLVYHFTKIFGVFLLYIWLLTVIFIKENINIKNIKQDLLKIIRNPKAHFKMFIGNK